MPRASKPWFRMYVEMWSDHKMVDWSAPQMFVWITMCAVARESPRPGWLLTGRNTPMSVAQLAKKARVRLATCKEVTELAQSFDMIEVVEGVIHLLNWDDRQFESDHVTPRTQALRRRSNATGRNTPTSFQRADVGTPPETETENRELRRTTKAEKGGDLVTRERPKPPPRFCPQHMPLGTDTACAACGRQRETWQAFDDAERAAETKATDRRRRAAQDAAINADLNRAPPNKAAFAAAKAAALANVKPRHPNPQPGVIHSD